MKRFRQLTVFLLISYFSWLWPHATLANAPTNLPVRPDNRPLHLLIPSIQLNTPVVPVGLRTIEIDGRPQLIWDTAQNNVGWHAGSGPPGRPGNTVLAGHSNGASEILRNLEYTTLGDSIYVQTEQGWYQYQITQKLILQEKGEPLEVRLANAQWILPTEDERLTLVTCWPYPEATHRLLVIAHLSSERRTPDLAATNFLDLARQTPEFPTTLSSPQTTAQRLSRQLANSIKAHWLNHSQFRPG